MLTSVASAATSSALACRAWKLARAGRSVKGKWILLAGWQLGSCRLFSAETLADKAVGTLDLASKGLSRHDASFDLLISISNPRRKLAATKTTLIFIVKPLNLS